MGLFIRLVIALLVIGAAYVLMASRVPALRGWYETNACPYLDRISDGLCRRTLRSNGLIQVSSAAARPGSSIETPQKVTERLDRLSTELAQLRQGRQEQDKAISEMRQQLEGLQQAVAGLRTSPTTTETVRRGRQPVQR